MQSRRCSAPVPTTKGASCVYWGSFLESCGVCLAQVITHNTWWEGWTPHVGMGEQGVKALRDAQHLFEKDSPSKNRKIKEQKKNRQKFAAYTNSLKNIDLHICKFTKLTWSYKNGRKGAQWNFIPCAQVFSRTAHVHIHMSYFLFILHITEVWISTAFQFRWENWRKLFVPQKETKKPEANDLGLSKIKR